MSKRNKAERDRIPIRAGRLTKRKPKPRKRKHRRPRHSGGDTVTVACSRCAYGIEMKRAEFGRESRRADRCALCGGNVVLAKYAEVGGKPVLANVRLTFGKWKGSRLGDAPRSYLKDLVDWNPNTKQFREFQNTVRQFLAEGSTSCWPSHQEQNKYER